MKQSDKHYIVKDYPHPALLLIGACSQNTKQSCRLKCANQGGFTKSYSTISGDEKDETEPFEEVFDLLMDYETEQVKL